MKKIEKKTDLFDEISHLIEQARRKVATTINREMVVLYWDIGKTIKKEIIKSGRADYGKQIIHLLSGELTQRYGKGFAEQSLWHIVKFYETYPILSAVRRELQGLSWTHIKSIIYLNDDLKRKFYATLSLKEHWSTRTLDERISSMLYERTALSKLPEKTIVMQLKELKEKDKMTPELVFRDPYVTHFCHSCESRNPKRYKQL